MASELGNLIAAARKGKGLSLRQLAKKISRSPSFLSVLENEDSAPPIKEETLGALAKELSLDINDLLGLAGKVPEEAMPDTGLEVALFRKVKGLSSDQKEKLLERLTEETK